MKKKRNRLEWYLNQKKDGWEKEKMMTEQKIQKRTRKNRGEIAIKIATQNVREIKKRNKKLKR